MNSLSVEAMQEVWRAIDDCCEPLPETMYVPLELLPYVVRDERGYFAGLDRSDGVVDAYEAELRREASAWLGDIAALRRGIRAEFERFLATHPPSPPE